MADASSNDFHLIIPETAQSVKVKLGSDVSIPCQLSPQISASDMEILWFKETDCVCLYKNQKVTKQNMYEVSLFTGELIRGNISLKLQHFRESDLGDYVCQVNSGDVTEEITIRVKEDTEQTSDIKQKQLQETPNKEEPRERSLLKNIALGAFTGAVCTMTPAGLIVGATLGAVHAMRGEGAAAAAEQQPLQLAVDCRKIIFSEVNRRWSEQERQKLEKSALMLEFSENSKRLKESECCLEERNEKIKDLEKDNIILLNEKAELRKKMQWKDKLLEEKDKILEEKDKLLQITNGKLSETERDVEKKQKEILEKNTQIEHMKMQVSENERELKKTTKELEASQSQLDTVRKKLQEHVRQLHEEVERLKRNPSSHSAVQVRRNSKDKIEPLMSGETSNPEASVLVPGSGLRLVLLGSAEAEKSAAGNIILNREKNQTDTAETQQSEIGQEEVDGKQVTVVETPDWFSSGLSLEEMRQDVRRCIRLSAPGPHAFLLVIPVNPATGVKREIMETMEEIFGERCWSNTIILLTVTDKEQEKNIEDFDQSENQEIQRLVEKCGNRFHCLNIHQSEDASQVSELLKKIEKMMEGNAKTFYSSEIYLEVEERKLAAVQKDLCKLHDIITSINITEFEG